MPVYFANRRGMRSGAAAAVASASTFLEIFGSDLLVWYDASDAASITHVAGAVSQWNDKSGNADHLVQATGANQPTYSATGLGGTQPSISFNAASTDFMATSAAAIATAGVSDFAVFIVGRLNTLTAAFGGLAGFVGNGQTNDFNNAGSARLMCRNNANQALSAYRLAEKGIKAITYDTTFRAAGVWSGGNHTTYVENVAGTPVADANGALTATGALYVGSGLNASATTDYFHGHLCEVAFVKIAPSAGQLSSAQTMLAAKWTA
jgi:hypothetical protein